MSTSTQTLSNSHGEGADRIGVVASVLCAIHCAATPVLLLLAPAFGELWSHPASHWIVALFVVPLAFVMVLRGFRVHRKRWIVATGLLGVALVIAGAAVPYFPESNESAAEDSAENALPANKFEANEFMANELPVDESAVVAKIEAPTETVAEEACTLCPGEEMQGDETELPAEECVDSCCPSLVTDGEGNTKLQIPTASVVTTLGGVALICTHLGNLCACRRRRGGDHCDSPLC